MTADRRDQYGAPGDQDRDVDWPEYEPTSDPQRVTFPGFVPQSEVDRALAAARAEEAARWQAKIEAPIQSHTWTPIGAGVEVWHNEGRVKYLSDGWFRIRALLNGEQR